MKKEELYAKRALDFRRDYLFLLLVLQFYKIIFCCLERSNLPEILFFCENSFRYGVQSGSYISIQSAKKNRETNKIIFSSAKFWNESILSLRNFCLNSLKCSFLELKLLRIICDNQNSI